MAISRGAGTSCTTAALAGALLLATTFAPATAVRAQAVTDQWSSATIPSPPPVTAVTVDPKTTALLVMDFRKAACTPQARPRCAAALPNVQKLLAAARTHSLFVVHTGIPRGTAADASPEVAPRAGEPFVSATTDKFLATQTDLQRLLKDHGIATVIATGTAANGAVLYTTGEAALRGFKVIVPVDAMPGDTPFTEAFTAWNLANAPNIGTATTLTKVDLIRFGP
jgi:nicotinamidase-related amidase